MSTSFLARHRIKSNAASDLAILLADGSSHSCTSSWSGTVRLSTFSAPVTAYAIPLGHHDLILGMDFLQQYNPSIDWRTKMVDITDLQGRAHSFSATASPARPGLALLSYAQLVRDVQCGAEAFLCFVHSAETPDPEPPPPKTIPDPHPAPLPPDQRRRLTQLLLRFSDVINHDPPKVLPPARPIDARIPLEPGSNPPNKAPYRQSVAELAELKRQLTELQERGYIRPSTSPFGAPVIFVKKKGGTLRMCIDYRALNKLTVKNATPLPRMDDLFDRMAGATIFSKIDLRAAYNQIRISPEDISKTAFNTRYGHFEFVVLPYGLCNAPATFQSLMNHIFWTECDDYVIVYVDDIFIFSKNADDHLEHIERVLSHLRQHKLYTAPAKCAFAQSRVECLGHIISAEGVHMMDAKVDSITNWPALRNAKHTARFLGLAGYYRKFVKSFSSIALPLTNLTKKTVPFTWGPSCDTAFSALKTAITSAPVLRLPDTTLPFLVTTDASQFAIGAVLAQEFEDGVHPVAFLSRKLRDPETRYATHDRELLALIHALRTWRHYLLGSPRSTAYTDHEALKFLSTQKNLNQRQARWIIEIQDYNLHVDYLPGRANVVADALSRRDTAELNSVTAVSSADDLLSKIKAAYPDDPLTSMLLLQLREGSMPKHSLLDGLITFSDGRRSRRIQIPNDTSIRQTLLREHHDISVAGHFGEDKTLELLSRSYFWRGMAADVRDYVSTCPSCSRSKATNRRSPGLLQPLPIPIRKWEQITLDLITQLPPTTSGYDAILTVVDKASKMIHVVPTHSNVDAPGVARLVFDNVIRLHGFPRSIVSDRDKRFTSNFWTALFDISGVKRNMSTAFHPQTDGQTERANRIVEDALRSYVNLRHDDWHLHLPAIELAYNNSKNSATGFSPFYLNYGYHPNLPASLAVPATTVNEAASEFIDRLNNDWRTARAALAMAQHRMSEYANRSRRDHRYKVGDKVWLSTANLMPEGPSRKLSAKWIGPFSVSTVISRTAYRLDLPRRYTIHQVFHVSRLKPFQPDTRFPRPEELNQPGPIPGTNDRYLVHSIIGSKWEKLPSGHHRHLYHVKWIGYPDSENKWLPLANLTGPDVRRMRNEYDTLHPLPKPQPKAKLQTRRTAQSRKTPQPRVSRTPVDSLPLRRSSRFQ
jgi:hypothetical protein